MNYLIPAKTFLTGEYVALQGQSAIVLTTEPCFKLSLTNEPGLHGIHPESPAGLWWQQQNIAHYGLSWEDPYAGLGGLGASSAQFIGAYLASCKVNKLKPGFDHLLKSYLSVAWQGVGIPPSGYDVLAQAQHQCVYLQRKQNINLILSWNFKDIAFVLLHTGKKLATHQHLQSLDLQSSLDYLAQVARQSVDAFVTKDSEALINSVNAYHDCLKQHELVAEHSLLAIDELSFLVKPLAIKGCGALGADVLLLIVDKNQLTGTLATLRQSTYKVLASSADLYQGAALI